MINYDNFLKEQLSIVEEKKRSQYRLEQLKNASNEYEEFDRLETLYSAYIEFISNFYPKWLEDMIEFYREDIFEEGTDNYMFNAILVNGNNKTRAKCTYSDENPNFIEVNASNTEFWDMLENFFIRNKLLVQTKKIDSEKRMYIKGTFEQLKNACYIEIQALPLYKELNDDLEMYDGANHMRTI